MQYLLTTSHAVLKFDSESCLYNEIHTACGLYYGVSQNEHFYFVAARGQLNSSPNPPVNERGSILVFDKALRLVDTWSCLFPLRDMHQILWWRDKLWVTCSFDNLVVMTADGQDWQKWYPLGQSTTEPFDKNHFNSLTPTVNQLIVIATNKGASDLLFFDADSLQLLQRMPMGIHAHNAWRNEDEWLTCSSGEGKIIGSKGFALTTGRFPRGVAFGSDEIIVGLSEMAERNERDFTDAALNIYTANWEFKKTITFPKYGLFLDVMPL